LPGYARWVRHATGFLQVLSDRWENLSGRNRILSAILTVSSGTTLVKIAGTAKVMLIARYYGLSDDLDAYLISFLIPSFLAEVVAGSISGALIPRFISASREGGEWVARQLLGACLLLCAGLCLTAAALAVFAARPVLALVASGFPLAKLDLTYALFLIQVPMILFSGIAAVGRAVLNALDRFALPATIPVLTPFVTILAVVASGDNPGAYPLAAATLAGSILEFLAVLWLLRSHGWMPSLRWSKWTDDLNAVVTQYWPLALSSLVLASAGYVDQAMAAMLGSGSVSALTYGGKVVNVFFAVGAVATSTAALPYFSRMAAERDWTAIRSTLTGFGRLILFAGVPATGLLILFSAPLVRLLFEGGAFTRQDSSVVVLVQQMHLIQIPFAILAALVARLISAFEANRHLLAAATLFFSSNAILNYLLMQRLGVAGIALATSLASALYFGHLMLALFRTGRRWRRHAA